jgi:hypothetical protein
MPGRGKRRATDAEQGAPQPARGKQKKQQQPGGSNQSGRGKAPETLWPPVVECHMIKLMGRAEQHKQGKMSTAAQRIVWITGKLNEALQEGGEVREQLIAAGGNISCVMYTKEQVINKKDNLIKKAKAMYRKVRSATPADGQRDSQVNHRCTKPYCDCSRLTHSDSLALHA